MLYVYCVTRLDRTDGIDEEAHICPLVISEDKDKAYKRACLYLKEAVEHDRTFAPLLDPSAIGEEERNADEKAKKLGYNGNELREDYAFVAYNAIGLFDVDFTELKVEEQIHVFI